MLDRTYVYAYDVGGNIQFRYNANGIRTEKIVNGYPTKYHLEGDRVTYERTMYLDDIYYTYDANGSLVSMNLNGIEYFYVKNGQGDIIALIDNTSAEVVSYTYDTWGKVIDVSSTKASTVGEKNPYRYRGYRYDSETGLYYLQSRYYNPEWGRFINADGILGKAGVLLSYNVFCYCGNNPVNFKDENGFFKSDIHYDATLRWAKSAGFTDAEAEIIASANNGVDSGTTNPLRFWDTKAQSWHFNTNGTKPDIFGNIPEDSRINHFNACFWDAVSLSKAGKKNEALAVLGRGLHALLDTEAHTDDVTFHIGFYFHLPFPADNVETIFRKPKLDAAKSLTMNAFEAFRSGIEE